MEDRKIQNFNEHQENLNTSDVIKSLSVEEIEMIERGKKHWDMDVLNKRHGGFVDSKTIKELIDKVIENTWTQAKIFYGNVEKDNES